MKKIIKKILNNFSKAINNAIYEIKDIFIWLKNRKTTQEEIINDEIDYTNAIVKITKLQHDIETAQQELDKQIRLKETYLKNCKKLRKKLDDKK